MVGRIYHVGLTVSDLDRSIAFYRDILGLVAGHRRKRACELAGLRVKHLCV